MRRRVVRWPVRGGTVRPMSPVPGSKPGIRMGAEPGWSGPDVARIEAAQEEIERGLAPSRLGAMPGDEPLDRAPYLPDLRESGARGAPLTVLRPFGPTSVVGGGGRDGGGPAAAATRPATDITKFWPFLFPPGEYGGEFPIVSVNAPVSVAAGGTTDLITMQELPRGMRGVVKKFGQTAADFTNLVWTFLIKGRPTDPIISITFQFGQLFQPVELPGSGVHLGPGDDFIVRVTNNGAGAVAGVRARIDLYWWRETP